MSSPTEYRKTWTGYCFETTAVLYCKVNILLAQDIELAEFNTVGAGNVKYSLKYQQIA